MFVWGSGEASSRKGFKTAGKGLEVTPMKRITYITASWASWIETIHVLWGLGAAERPSSSVGSNYPLLEVPVCRSPKKGPYQQRARMPVASADENHRPPSPQVGRREVLPHLCTRRAGAGVRTGGARAGTRNSVVGLAGQGPLAPSPRWEVSPSPRRP